MYFFNLRLKTEFITNNLLITICIIILNEGSPPDLNYMHLEYILNNTYANLYQSMYVSLSLYIYIYVCVCVCVDR